MIRSKVSTIKQTQDSGIDFSEFSKSEFYLGFENAESAFSNLGFRVLGNWNGFTYFYDTVDRRVSLYTKKHHKACRDGFQLPNSLATWFSLFHEISWFDQRSLVPISFPLLRLPNIWLLLCAVILTIHNWFMDPWAIWCLQSKITFQIPISVPTLQDTQGLQASLNAQLTIISEHSVCFQSIQIC